MKFQCPTCNRIAHATEEEFEDILCSICNIAMEPIEESKNRKNKKQRFDDDYF